MIAHDTESDTADIRRFLGFLFEPGDVFEVRSPKVPKRRGSDYCRTWSGYFDDHDAAVGAIESLDRSGLPPAVYCTINPVRPDLLARAANRIQWDARETTKDEHIVRRRHVLIDADPVRPSGISSSDAELEAARLRIEDVREYLVETFGFPPMLSGCSGNGWHLIPRVDLPADSDSLELVSGLLEALSERFSDDVVKIDVSVSNSSRITKVLGTVTRKGDAVADRPHRRSRIETEPDGVATREMLEAVASLRSAVTAEPAPAGTRVPTRPPAPRPAGSPPSPDPRDPGSVRQYLEHFGIEIVREQPAGRGTKLVLAACPVTGNDAHGSEMAVLIDPAAPSISYCNLHDHGRGLTWRGVREAIDPDYVERRRAWEERQEARNRPQAAAEASEPEDDPDDGNPVPKPLRGRDGRSRLVCLRDIACDLTGEDVKVWPTGLEWFDQAMPESGILAGDKILLGAVPGGGKTSFAMAVYLAALQSNPELRVVHLAGEMRLSVLNRRLQTLATGLTKHVLRRPDDELGPMQRDRKARGLAALRAVEDRLWILPAPIGPEAAEAAVEETGAGLVVVDYAQLMRSAERMASRREEVEETVHRMVELADTREVAVIWLSSAAKPSIGRRLDEWSAFKETAELRQQADIVYLGDEVADTRSRDVEGHDSVEIRWKCIKCRDGERKDISVRFTGATMRFAPVVEIGTLRLSGSEGLP